MHLLNNIVAFPDIDQCKFERFYFEAINEFDTGEKKPRECEVYLCFHEIFIFFFVKLPPEHSVEK